VSERTSGGCGREKRGWMGNGLRSSVLRRGTWQQMPSKLRHSLGPGGRTSAGEGKVKERVGIGARNESGKRIDTLDMVKNEERGEMMKRRIGKRKMKETYRGCGSVR